MTILVVFTACWIIHAIPLASSSTCETMKGPVLDTLSTLEHHVLFSAACYPAQTDLRGLERDRLFSSWFLRVFMNFRFAVVRSRASLARVRASRAEGKPCGPTPPKTTIAAQGAPTLRAASLSAPRLRSVPLRPFDTSWRG